MSLDRPAITAATRDRIAEWLPLFFAPDDVLEVRALITEPSNRRMAGFMLARDIAKMAPEIERIGAIASGIYFTPQRLSPALSKRCYGVLGQVRGMKLTEDADVLGRRYLIVDVDSVRAAGCDKLSATDAERDAAFAVAGRVREQLASQGWPAPLAIDSGNGCHLYYRLPEDQPGGHVAKADTDPIALLLRVLSACCSTTGAKVDTGIYNAARVMRIPGSMARKGANTTHRPHRLCHVIDGLETWGKAPAGGYDVLATLNALDPDGDLRGGKSRLGGRKVPKSAGVATGVSAPVPAGEYTPLSEIEDRVSKWITSGPGGVEGDRGDRCFAVTQALYHGFCLDESDTLHCLRTYFSPMCRKFDGSPYPWDEKELAHKVDQARKYPPDKPRGWLLNAERPASRSGDLDPSVLVAVAGQPSGVPNGSPSLPPTEPDKPALTIQAGEKEDNPHRFAFEYLDGKTQPGDRHFQFWQGSLYRWGLSKYEEMDEPGLKADMTRFVHKVYVRDWERAMEEWKGTVRLDENNNPDKPPPEIKGVSLGHVANCLGAVYGETVLSKHYAPPCWIGVPPGDVGVAVPHPSEIVATLGGLVHLPAFAAGKPEGVIPYTPAYFNLSAVPYAVSHDAPPPARWLAFLNQLWPHDHESIALLQEWFGYLLTPDVSLQKMLLMKGPKRAGKGVILGVIRGLLGEAAHCSWSYSTLSEAHGLEEFPGKLVAINPDGHHSRRVEEGMVLDRLKSISGADAVSVNRKNRPHITALLTTRIVVACNQLPRFRDPSGAFPSRWSVLKFTETFHKKEDPKLLAALIEELPRIFRWAVDGWVRLQAQGRFTEPASSQDLVNELYAGSSPVRAFVDERCSLGVDKLIAKRKLRDEYGVWRAKRLGKTTKISDVEFGKSLLDCTEGIQSAQRRLTTGGKLVECYKGITLKELDLDHPDQAAAPPVTPELQAAIDEAQKREDDEARQREEARAVMESIEKRSPEPEQVLASAAGEIGSRLLERYAGEFPAHPEDN